MSKSDHIYIAACILNAHHKLTYETTMLGIYEGLIKTYMQKCVHSFSAGIWKLQTQQLQDYHF